MTTLDRNSFLAGKLREFYESHPVSTEILEAANALDALSSLPAQAVKPGTLELIEQMIAGTAPMSKWMASVDYSSYDGFEEYLKAQLREKLMLKATLDPNRKDGEKEENLATFVDAGAGALEGALATYRVVRQRVAALSPPSQPAAVGVPRLENCGTYIAKDNKGQWYYLNHGNTWQTYQGPSQPAADAAAYPHHERGFLSKPLIDAIEAALVAVLRSTP